MSVFEFPPMTTSSLSMVRCFNYLKYIVFYFEQIKTFRAPSLCNCALPDCCTKKIQQPTKQPMEELIKGSASS